MGRVQGTACAAVVGLSLLTATAPATAVTFQWAAVGNPGNTADSTTGSGAVGYSYDIDKYEVTNGQYVEFLNAVDPAGANTRGLYNSYMSDYPGYVYSTGGIDFASAAASGSKYSVKTGQGNKPVIWVSWNDAARFVNWLGNGQGNGSTESGVYDMTQTYPTRAANATLVIPSENEWYKAAYYDPTKNGGTGGYWLYPTRSSTAPSSQPPPGGTNSANYYIYPTGYALSGSMSLNNNQNYLTDVGAYGNSSSYYGTFDQGGNVWEWDEALISRSYRGVRGGAWTADYSSLYASSYRDYGDPSEENYYFGFRVASIPEPASGAVLLALGALALGRRRRWDFAGLRLPLEE